MGDGGCCDRSATVAPALLLVLLLLLLPIPFPPEALAGGQHGHEAAASAGTLHRRGWSLTPPPPRVLHRPRSLLNASSRLASMHSSVW
ncbi:hypothetical protein BDA96_06G285900 [Sorghum bicolor]|uniref:Uncharacterized protein n=2 Tax=Sorghum bicolor TaxID=4558 RepID=A0A921UDJ6_SORBI|nr:hypothetical protein BDA96_06G285900 [Sorghum bicolor]